MKDYRFYKEWLTPQDRKENKFSIIAINTTTKFEGRFDGIAPAFNTNDNYSSCIIANSHLKEHCRRISEQEARNLSPKLFEILKEK